MIQIDDEMAPEVLDTLVVSSNIPDSRTLPIDWKLANVTLQFKKQRQKQMKYYNPLSLVSIGRKLIKSVIKKMATRHNHNNMIGQIQQVFMEGILY